MSYPLVVKDFFVFTSQHKGGIESEHEKILYFYPDGRTQDEQLSVIGLCHALLSFSSIFSTSCTSLHTRKGKRHFYQMSDNIWAVMNVSIVDPSTLPYSHDVCDRIIDDNVISNKLAYLCQRFELFYGPLLIKSDAEIANSRENLRTFFDKELAVLDLTFHDISDLMDGIRWKCCNPKFLLSLENLGTRIQLTSPLPDTNVALFYDAQLVWSSLPSKVILPILRFVTSDLMCLPPDLDLDAISPTAPHMGRFLTGPPTMSTEMCPPQVSIPTVFLRLSTSNFQRFRLIIYRALRLTVCLFIDEKYDPEDEFFRKFDSTYGGIMTELSCQIDCNDAVNPSPTSDASALSVVNVDPTLKSGSGNYSSSFILWEPDLGLVNTDLFIPHSGGGRSEVIPAFAPYLPFLYAMRCDIVSCFDQRWHECLLKLEPDVWLHFRRLNGREVFLVIIAKKAEITRVISESKRFWTERLSGLFLTN